MLFIAPPATAAEIRAFCAQFGEGIRVEYKSTFDDNVRRHIAKVLSSFANSLGGVLVIGVVTQNGIPQEPVEGFPTPAEELPLTIENICFQNIYPPLTPRIYMVRSDIEGRSFAVIEIDESWEAPHAIENSKKAYVRTGNAANPYDIADVDLIIELVRRRAEPAAKRTKIIDTARRRASTVIREETIHVEIGVCPSYPRRPLCARSDCWNFMADSRYQGAHYFPFHTMRRVDDGVASYNGNNEYGQLNIDGLLFVRRVMELTGENPQNRVILLRELFHPVVKLLHCAREFYRQTGYHGSLSLDVNIHNIRLQRMLFLPGVRLGIDDLNNFMCFETSICATDIIQSENLIANLSQILQGILRQACWSFWQSTEAFPAATLDESVTRLLREMRIA